MKYMRLVRKHFSEKPVFSLADLRRLLAEKGISKEYSVQLVHNLLAKGEIARIAKGVYSFQKDSMVAGFAFSPFYYGLQEALSLWGLWEQETNPVIITPRKVRTGTRKILGGNVLVRRIARKMFFGFGMVKYYGMWVPVSDAEKTLIDFVYFKEHLPEQALNEILQRTDRKKLNAYLEKCGPRTAKKAREKMGKQRERN